MRVYLEPTGTYSRAMTRVARALEFYSPSGIRILKSSKPGSSGKSGNSIDLRILHVTSRDAIPYCEDLINKGTKYAIIQYCYQTSGAGPSEWSKVWEHAELVWSYYDLSIEEKEFGFKFYHSPLGVDKEFTLDRLSIEPREKAILTTGYVSGSRSEPIEDVWIAAEASGLKIYHIGPTNVQGLNKKHPKVVCHLNVSDEFLGKCYRSVQYVSGLRHVEGFELPAAEGLSSGARALVFDQPDMRHWYSGLADFLPDIEDSSSLIPVLVDYFQSSSSLDIISESQKLEARARFNWKPIAERFWERLLS